MKTLVALALIAGSLACAPAHAQERAGSAAIGVVAGALILGPVGAVAGGLVGYTAGPEMSRGLAGEQPRARSKARRPARTARDSKRTVAANPPPVAAPPVARSAEAAQTAAKTSPSIRATQPLPPVQSLD